MFEGNSKKKILLIRTSSLGDLVHSIPSIHAIKKSFDCEISFLTNREYGEFVRCFNDVDRVLTFNRKQFTRGLIEIFYELRKERYDLVIDLQGLLKSAIIASFARSPRKIGPSYHREFSHLFYDEIFGVKDMNRHAVERTFDVIKHLGIDFEKKEFPINLPPHGFEIPNEGKNIAIIGDARWKSKLWPYDYFGRLSSMLIKEGFNVYLLGSSDDWKKGIQKFVDERTINLIGKTTIVELCSILKDMNLVISNDSGPMHIAAALGVNVIALMGPTDPRRTGPFGDGHRVFSGRASCAPCFRKDCEDNICMKKITPEEIFKAAKEMLQIPEQR